MSAPWPDYTRFPMVADGPYPNEETMAAMELEFAKILNAWLERCTESWCPEALDAKRKGDTIRAIKILNEHDFYCASLPGKIYEFRQGETVLARCKIEWKIKGALKPGYEA